MFSGLTSQQKQQFISDGYTVVSGLVPLEIVVSTREEICRALGITLDDAATWPESERAVPVAIRELTSPCFTPELDAAARDLVGDIAWPQHCFSSILDKNGEPPYVNTLMPVLAYPRAGEKKLLAPWPGGFHVDGIHGARLWPNKMIVVGLMYLTDTTAYGGATAVIPGSHRQIFEYWMKRGESPEGHAALLAGIENPRPVAVPGRAGDVIFMHHLLVHSGTPNHDNHVRVALNANLAARPEQPYTARSGAPQDDWTPLDWTLRTDTLAADKTPGSDGLHSFAPEAGPLQR